MPEVKTIEKKYRNKKVVAYFKDNKIIVDVYNNSGRKLNSVPFSLSLGEK